MPDKKSDHYETPQCAHLRTNGLRCGSPALRNRRFCYFHHRQHDVRALRRRQPSFRFELPLLEDAESIQMSIQDVLAAVHEDRIDVRRAGLLLYGLNTASSNLKRLNCEPRELREQAHNRAFWENNEIARVLLEEIVEGFEAPDSNEEAPSKNDPVETKKPPIVPQPDEQQKNAALAG